MLKKILISSCILVVTSLCALDSDLYVLDKDGQKRALTKTNKEDMSMFVSSNVTRRSLKTGVYCNEEINILHTDKYMHIESKQFGPAPVELIVLDENDNKLFKISKESTEYKFKVNLKDLEKAKIVKVVNTFGDYQLCKKIVFGSL